MKLFGDGGAIRLDTSRGYGNEWMRLNDLHEASGGDPSKKPAEWLRLESTKALVKARGGDSHLESFQVLRGGNELQGTWAHWELATAYAEWLSSSFHLQVIREWRQFNELKQSVPQIDLQAVAAIVAQTVALAVGQLREEMHEDLGSLRNQTHASIGDEKHHDLMARMRRSADLRVLAGFEKNKESARRVVHNKVGGACSWGSNKGERWAILPLAKLPTALGKIDELDSDAMRAIKLRGPVTQTVLPFVRR